jgi:hypothetical protein
MYNIIKMSNPEDNQNNNPDKLNIGNILDCNEIKKMCDSINNKLHTIDYNNWENLDKSVRCAILDINLYFKRVNKAFELINNLENDFSSKIKEVDKFIAIIRGKIDELYKDSKIYNIDERIDTLDDLIFVAKKYGSLVSIKRYTVDTKILYNLVKPLDKLKDVVGMDDIKNQVVDQIVVSLQNLYDDDMRFHTVIKGPPGV